MMQKSHDDLLCLSKERLTFPLACFLVAAQTNSYSCYFWGCREMRGTFNGYQDSDKSLGPSLGEAKRTGWLYEREFTHASVSVNLETKATRINWK